MSSSSAASWANGSTEWQLHRAQVPRLTPFPTWNGVLASATTGVLSVLCEDGAVVLLRVQDAASRQQPSVLCVADVLPAGQPIVMQMCQCWMADGMRLVVARDHYITMYAASPATPRHFQPRAAFLLRLAATAMDVLEHGSDCDAAQLIVGTSAGLHVFQVEREHGQPLPLPLHDTATMQQPIASAMQDTAICFVKLSPDAQDLAVGTVDGRLIVLSVETTPSSTGIRLTELFTKVLAAPRVTSICFSPCGRFLLASNRKGQVALLSRGARPHAWRAHECVHSNGDLPAMTAPAATFHTLICWWGTSLADAAPIFVISNRVEDNGLECFDAMSATVLHSMRFQPPASPPSTAEESRDRHLVGICCLPSASAEQNEPRVPALVLIDSSGNLCILRWAFLDQAGPHLADMLTSVAASETQAAT